MLLAVFEIIKQTFSLDVFSAVGKDMDPLTPLPVKTNERQERNTHHSPVGSMGDPWGVPGNPGGSWRGAWVLGSIGGPLVYLGVAGRSLGRSWGAAPRRIQVS